MVTDAVYGNNEADLATLLPLTAEIIPSGSNPSFNAYFNVGPIVGVDKILYLVWDLRKAKESFLCFDANTTSIGLNAVCCECSCSEVTTEYEINNTGVTTITITYNTGTDSVVLLGGNSVDICSNSYPAYMPTSATGVTISIINCDCA